MAVLNTGALSVLSEPDVEMLEAHVVYQDARLSILSEPDVEPLRRGDFFQIPSLRRLVWALGPLSESTDDDAVAAFLALHLSGGVVRPVWIHKVPSNVSDIFLCEWAGDHRSRSDRGAPDEHVVNDIFVEVPRLRRENTESLRHPVAPGVLATLSEPDVDVI